jgi:hypothetical protein
MGCQALRISCHYFLVVNHVVHVVRGIGIAPHRPPPFILMCLSAAVLVLIFIVSVLVSGIGSASYDPGLMSIKLMVRFVLCYLLKRCHGRSTA